MAVRPIDAAQVLKDINWHHKPTPVSEFESGVNQGLNQAMWIITHAPTLTPPNEPLTCEGCACESYPRDCYPCNTCNRNDETLSDQYRPPEGEEDT